MSYDTPFCQFCSDALVYSIVVVSSLRILSLFSLQRALTWKLESAARGLSFQRTLDIIRSAFKKWEKAVNINFFEVNKYDADIIVKFTTGQHTDPYPFDGQGGNVAHSFFPFPGYG